MAVVLKEIVRNYNKILYLDSDPRTTQNFPITSSPLLVLAIVIIYVQFVTKWGPAFMKDREPFQLDKIIQAYNVFQVITCSYIVYMGYTYAYGPSGTYNLWCQPVDYTVNEVTDAIVNGVFIYYMLKVSDLLDTVFFVLRKKNSQVTFLHIYHHCGMVILTWVGLRYIAGGSSMIVGWINSMVHVIMYSYYFLTSWNPLLKANVWWKRYVTQVQIIQFLFFFVWAVKLIFSPSCGYPKLPTALMIPQNLFMLLMFLDFYKKAYFSKKIEKETN